MNGKNLLNGMGCINRKYVEESENDTVLEKAGTQERTKPYFRRPLMIAATVALMLFLMGCAVALLHLEDLHVGEAPYTDYMRYAEDGSKIPATEKVMQFISIAGAEGSRNHLALQEWMDFKQSYDPDGTLRSAARGYEKPAQYNDYVDVYTQEMVDKIDEICQKYGLKLAGDSAIFQEGDEGLFAQTLGIHGVVKDGSPLQTEFGGARVAECGNFNAAYNATLQKRETGQEYTFSLVYDYRDKTVFTSVCLTIEDGESVQQWNCALPDGTQVLMVSDKGGNAYILYDREDAFVNVTIKNVGWNWDSPGDVMTREDMERIAQALDYSLKPKQVENIAQVQEQLDAARQARENQPEDSAEAEMWKQLYEENEHRDSYAELIQRMRDNEDYFTSRCSVAYENFWDSMEYTLLDVIGDGEDELILGKEGHIHAIWAMRGDKTERIASSYYEGYLCEGNVYENYVFLDGKPYHTYFRLDGEEYPEPMAWLEYEAVTESWLLSEYPDAPDPKTITEEQAMEIIDSYVRIPLEMKSVKEFPMN